MRHVLWLSIIMLAAGCGGESWSDPAAAAEQPLPVPVEMRVTQRSTTPLPGWDEALRLTVDDITRSQVMASLAGADGDVVLAETSLSRGDSATFRFQGRRYQLTLSQLDNALMGDDFATFTVDAADDQLTEQAKIERLIQHVGQLQDAVFIRNGSEYDGNEAAEHLRSKWQARADSVETAEQFVERIATRSSMSGEPYKIRFRSGVVELAGEYLHKQLAAMEKSQAQ